MASKDHPNLREFGGRLRWYLDLPLPGQEYSNGRPKRKRYFVISEGDRVVDPDTGKMKDCPRSKMKDQKRLFKRLANKVRQEHDNKYGAFAKLENKGQTTLAELVQLARKHPARE